MSYDIKLQNFEGPLDLLLHLIRQNEMDITDIRIAEITHQYLDIIERMQQLNLDVAGEFLLMAATLLHIKSRLLLPVTDEAIEEEEEEDPRAELVRRLLEYQKYKEAAECLEALPQLDRDQFVRRYPLPELAVEEDVGFEQVGLYELAAAFRQMLAECPAETVHEVNAETLSVTDRINAILDRLAGGGHLGFDELFTLPARRLEIIVSFLAVLELVKMRLVRLVQTAGMGPIWLYPAVALTAEERQRLQEDDLGYA